jgi:hypothetical protein
MTKLTSLQKAVHQHPNLAAKLEWMFIRLEKAKIQGNEVFINAYIHWINEYLGMYYGLEELAKLTPRCQRELSIWEATYTVELIEQGE